MKINLPFINEHYTNKLFHLNVGNMKIPQRTNNKIKAEFPGIQIMPLKVNINRLIYCSTPPKDPPTIIIPKNLRGIARGIRIIYECSGLVKGNSLKWNLLINPENQEDINKLTNLWAFLARTDDINANFYILQNLKQTLGKLKITKSFVKGQLTPRISPAYDEQKITTLVSNVASRIGNDFYTADWSRATGGIPPDQVTNIREALLDEFETDMTTATARSAKTFNYAAYIKKGTKNPVNHDADINNEYTYYRFDPNSGEARKSATIQTQEFYGNQDLNVNMVTVSRESVRTPIISEENSHSSKWSGGSVITLRCKRHRSEERERRKKRPRTSEVRRGKVTPSEDESENEERPSTSGVKTVSVRKRGKGKIMPSEDDDSDDSS